MSYSSGSFSLVSGNPVVTGTVISSTWANNTLSDVASGLSTCVLKDGTQTVTANLPMNAHKLTGLSAGSATGDSLRYEQLFTSGAVTLLGGMVFAGATDDAAQATVASAATTNLETATSSYVTVSGNTTITAITLNNGAERTVEFQGALTLTNGASLILPGAANITTAAGDVAIFRGESGSVVRCVSYMRAASPPDEQPVASVNSASTVNLETAGSQYVQISGTTTINAITLNNGSIRFVEFSGSLQLTNGASLVLPGNGNINTVAGATAVFAGESGGVVRCLSYFAASTFTATLTGCTASITGTAAWSQNGNVVTVTYPVMTGTSNSTGCTVTGQPNPLKPTTAHLGFNCIIQDNSSPAGNGRADVDTAGQLTLFNGVSSAVFTAANVKGLIAGLTITYNLN